jgi:predicted nucleic acid-binding OB-fold protein
MIEETEKSFLEFQNKSKPLNSKLNIIGLENAFLKFEMHGQLLGKKTKCFRGKCQMNENRIGKPKRKKNPVVISQKLLEIFETSWAEQSHTRDFL